MKGANREDQEGDINSITLGDNRTICLAFGRGK